MKNLSGISFLTCAAILLGVGAPAALAAHRISGSTQSGPPASQTSAVLLASISDSQPAASAPAVAAMTASSNSASEATLKEIVRANNSPTRYWFTFGTSKKSLSSATAKAVARPGTSAVTAKVKGLKPKTTYYFQFYASNAEGTTSAGIQSVTTGEAVPTVAQSSPSAAPNLTASLTQ
ncbi:MAG: fibronectin type III domain-containing protein [Terracidiphilus sp.]